MLLVTACGVQGEVADDFSGGLVHDRDVAVFDDEDDAGSGVGSADADGVHAGVVAEADFPGSVDPESPRG